MWILILNPFVVICFCWPYCRAGQIASLVTVCDRKSWWASWYVRKLARLAIIMLDLTVHILRRWCLDLLPWVWECSCLGVGYQRTRGEDFCDWALNDTSCICFVMHQQGRWGQGRRHVLRGNPTKWTNASEKKDHFLHRRTYVFFKEFLRFLKFTVWP